MKISLIAAFSNNLTIGNKNTIPWYLPEDIKWFKKNTIYKNVIMGRATWQSIGRPLPMRKNIVISRFKIQEKGIIWANSIYKAILSADADKEIMIIGGEKIYYQMLDYANQLYLTHININVQGDTYFPKYKLYPFWKVLFKQHFKKNTKNRYDYCFEILSR